MPRSLVPKAWSTALAGRPARRRSGWKWHERRHRPDRARRAPRVEPRRRKPADRLLPARRDPVSLRDRARSRVAGAGRRRRDLGGGAARSEEHTSELQSLMRISYAVFCLKKKK